MNNDKLVQELQKMQLKIEKLEAEIGRKQVSRFAWLKRHLQKRVLIPFGVVSFLAAATLTFAATIPNSFTSGDPISASQMNENFSYIIDRLWEVTGANLHYSAGNVGIGTSSPSQKLEVIGTVDADSFTVNGTPVGTSTDAFWNNPSAPDIGYVAGRVGIGTTAPAYTLHVVGDVGLFERAGKQVMINPNYTATNVYASISSDAGMELRFGANDVDTGQMTIDTTGQVGIGTTAPTARLHLMSADVNGPLSIESNNAGFNPWMEFINDQGDQTSIGVLRSGLPGDGTFLIRNYTVGVPIVFELGGTNERMRILDTGEVGIRTTTPVNTLDVVGTAGLSTGTAWTNTSDVRLKNIKGEYQKGLEEITRLRPVEFRYKEGNPRNLPSDIDLIGFTAQEVQEVFPESVSNSKDGYLEFNIHAINIAVINALKELKAENEALRQRIALLEKSR